MNVKEYLKNLKVHLSTNDISDVILSNGCFKNMMTGKEGEALLDVVREKKRFLVFEDESRLPAGYYAFIDKSADLFIMVEAKFSWEDAKWKPVLMFAFDKDGNVDGDYPFAYPVIAGDNVDICGQANVYRNGSYPVEMQKRAEEFFGGPLAFVTENGKCTPYGFYPHSLVNLAAKCWKWHITGCQVSFNSLGQEKLAELPVPDEAQKRLDDYGHARADCSTHIFMDKVPCVSILQKDGKIPVLRRFAFVFDGDREASYCYTRPVEFDRVYFAGDMDYSRRLKTDSTLLWCDSMEDTVFEDMEILREATEGVEIPDGKLWLAPDIHNWEMLGKYGAESEDLVYLAYRMGNDCIFDSVVKSCVGTAFIKKIVADILSGASTEEVLTKYFGEIDRDKKTMPYALGVSDDMVNIFTSYGLMDDILYVKKMFDIDYKTRHFLRNMTVAGIHFIANVLSRAKFSGRDDGNSYRYTAGELAQCIQDIISVYGISNLQSALEWVYGNIGFCTQDCRAYIRYIARVRKAVEAGLIDKKTVSEKCPWKPASAKHLWDASEFVLKLNELIGNYEYLQRAFDKKQEHWAKYAFKKDGFVVTWPKSPVDILNEGMPLQPCAYSFIDDVACGNTTVLFIRKKEDPECPYFAVEMTDNRVCQVHGFCNKAVWDVPELQRFLTDFYKEKGIILPFS